LCAAGFDPGSPAVWLAEGLFLYLPAAVERRLVAMVDQLAVPGSVCAFEAKFWHETPAVRSGPIYRSTREQIGVDLTALFDAEARPDSAGAFRALGWSTSVRTPFEFSAALDAGLEPVPGDALASNRWVFATKEA
jgi:O-methyltransferase involved in polyketide biosynthesis